MGLQIAPFFMVDKLNQSTIMDYNIMEFGMDQYPYYPFVKTTAGREQSKRPKQKNDCTVRALAVVASLPYDEAYELLKGRGRSSHQGCNFPNRRRNDSINNVQFIWKSFPAIKGSARMNPKDFCNQFKNGKYIVKTARHVFAVIDGVVYDDGPERPDRCIYGAWEVIE